MLVTSDPAAIVAAEVPQVDVGRVSLPVPEAENVVVEETTAVAEEQPLADEENATGKETRPTQIDWQRAAREAVAQAVNLPPAVRAHFTRSLDDAKDALRDALGRPLIPVADAVAALAAALPANWIANPASLQQLHHPAGEGFFDISADTLSDERAAQIVRQQFAATGYLKPEPATT
jgi:hypothetical protein